MIKMIIGFLCVIYAAAFLGVDPADAAPNFLVDLDSKLGGPFINSLNTTHTFGEQAIGEFINYLKKM